MLPTSQAPKRTAGEAASSGSGSGTTTPQQQDPKLRRVDSPQQGTGASLKGVAAGVAPAPVAKSRQDVEMAEAATTEVQKDVEMAERRPEAGPPVPKGDNLERVSSFDCAWFSPARISSRPLHLFLVVSSPFLAASTQSSRPVLLESGNWVCAARWARWCTTTRLGKFKRKRFLPRLLQRKRLDRTSLVSLAQALPATTPICGEDLKQRYKDEEVPTLSATFSFSRQDTACLIG